MDKIPPELQPFINSKMTRSDIALMGNYLLKLKIQKMKDKFKRVFGKHEKH